MRNSAVHFYGTMVQVVWFMSDTHTQVETGAYSRAKPRATGSATRNLVAKRIDSKINSQLEKDALKTTTLMPSVDTSYSVTSFCDVSDIFCSPEKQDSSTHNHSPSIAFAHAILVPCMDENVGWGYEWSSTQCLEFLNGILPACDRHTHVEIH